ncbi:unnamed protein product [Microthlaspi erraticum]|uniref:F-box domain-containing protein n=1 Tax=Microthlaspi erraticum TaxID=1685480 RepID=A0A6D2J8B0_9BRAS|nr:unnamed protein product [Microthlaspi erraticum]
MSEPSSSAFTSLPDDVVLNCLARVSRSDHASLSLVSKSHRSLLRSPELYGVRSRMGLTEKCIFLCLSIPSDPFARWFVFNPKAVNNPGRLVPIRPHLSQRREVSAAVVAHGCGIYIIGGMIGGRRSSKVFFLDGRTHTWTNLPSMRQARADASAAEVDGKIYVLGGCEDENSREYGEVFDPKTQTWDVLPVPPYEDCVRHTFMCESAVVIKEEEKKVFGLNGIGKGLFYIPSQGKWEIGNRAKSGAKRGWHVIGNVIYTSATRGRIMWCEASELERRQPGGMEWREVMGLEHLRRTLHGSKLVSFGCGMLDKWEYYLSDMFCKGPTCLTSEIDYVYPGHKLSNLGPNLLLYWDVLGPRKLEIFCAEISLHRRKDTGQIWGSVLWYDAVMTVHRKTNRFDIPLKLAISVALPALFGIWLGLSIAISVLVGVGYGFFTPWISAFEAFRQDTGSNKFFHCLVDGTWGTIKGSCTVVTDFADLCYHILSTLKELRESSASDELQTLRLIHVLGCIIVGIIGLFIDIPLFTAIAVIKSPYLLFKAWYRLAQDAINREGPFLEIACIPVTGLTILFWPIIVIGFVLMTIFSSIFIGLYGAVAVFQERSFTRGVSYVIAVVGEFDEYTNDWLYLREGTIFPKYVSFSTFHPSDMSRDNSSGSVEAPAMLVPSLVHSVSVREAIKEVRMVQVYVKSCNPSSVSHKMMGMVRSVSKLPTYRRRFRKVVKALITYWLEKQGLNRTGSMSFGDFIEDV